MKSTRWSQYALALLIAMASLTLMTEAGVKTPVAEKKIEIHFPSAPNLICGVAEPDFIKSYPDGVLPTGQKQRDYVRQLFEEVYPEIVKVYGEPLTSASGVLSVAIYYVPGSGSSMYLSHKSDTEARLLAAAIGAALGIGVVGAPCLALAEIPDHALFLNKLPGEDNFDHLFTHELIHSFHDRMSFFGWYTRSWVEEGMTEAATEIVADQMKAHYLRDIRDYGINGSPADNLKHFDMWNYPLNGAAKGRDIGSHALGSLHFFYAGIALDPKGDDIKFGANMSVIPTEIRYAAATSIWLMLTKSLSTDHRNPDFLKRLNHQLDIWGITSLSDNNKLFDEIEKVVGSAAAIDGLPLRQWMERQGLLHGTYRDDGMGTVFIHVHDPENFQAGIDDNVNIEVYALYPISLGDPGDLAGNLNGAELPLRNCSVKLKIIDAAGNTWFETDLTESAKGTYIFNDTLKDSAGKKILLPEGGYVIQATANDCDRLSLDWGKSIQPGNVTSATYALRSGKTINGEDNRILGIALNKPDIFSGAQSLSTMGVAAKVFMPAPNYFEFPVLDEKGAYRVDDHGQNRPFEVIQAQRLETGSKNQRRINLPYPYTRVNWIEPTPDFLVEVESKEATVELLGSTETTARLIPNGLVAKLASGVSCPVLLGTGALPAGVKVEFEGSNPRILGFQAPDPTLVKMKVQLMPEAKPDRYDIKVIASGSYSGNCSEMSRSAVFQLLILKPIHLALRAEKVNTDGATSSIKAQINVSDEKGTGVWFTPADLKPGQYSELTFTAQGEIIVDGQKYQFANWEFNNDSGQRDSRNPLINQKISDDMTLTARYIRKETVSVTVDALTKGATAAVQISVPISYHWGTSGGPAPVLTTSRAALAGPTLSGTGSGTQTTTFEIVAPRSVTIYLEAPIYAKDNGKFYKFVYWQIGSQTLTTIKASYNTASGNATVFAFYQSTPSVFEGTLEGANSTMISGWAWDRSQPDGAISVDIYDGSTKLAAVMASEFRPYLLSAGVGNGYHGFVYPVPAALKDGKPHLISARFAGSAIELGNSPITLTVAVKPVITAQPVSLTVCNKQSATFTVAATGIGLKYQWLKNGAPLTGATGSKHTIASPVAGDAGLYSVIVWNEAGSVTSSQAGLTVNAPVAITSQPVSVFGCQGKPVTFSVTATGDGVRYQWRKNGGNISGATGNSFAIPVVSASDAGIYTVVVYNGCSSVTSYNANLTFTDLITVTGQPANLTKLVGQSATFTVAATGLGIRYQWRGKDGGNILGATGSSYTIPSVKASDAGSYYVVVYNGCATINSATANLTVSSANPGNNARVEYQSVTQTMTAGQTYYVSVKMRNTGTTAWTKAGGYKLLSQSPQGNSIWGVSSVDIPPATAQVTQNGLVTFSFTVKAPSAPGSYVFEWRMAENGAGFGTGTTAVLVTVR